MGTPKKPYSAPVVKKYRSPSELPERLRIVLADLLRTAPAVAEDTQTELPQLPVEKA